jgi:WD40 repeat protein
VAFSPDGTWLVSSDQSGEVIRHEFGRPAPRWTANVLKDLASYCLAISPDQRFIATSFAVYFADTGETVLYDINSAWRGVYSAAFTSDGTRLVGVTDNGYVVVLDTRTWQLVEQEKWCNDAIVAMSVSPDGNQIVTGDDGKMIRLGTISPLRQAAVIGQHTARVKAVAFSPDGKQVASAGDDKMVALWDVNRRKLITTIGTHTSPIYVLTFSPDGTRLFTGEHDRSVRQYTRRRSLWGFSLD